MFKDISPEGVLTEVKYKNCLNFFHWNVFVRRKKVTKLNLLNVSVKVILCSKFYGKEKKIVLLSKLNLFSTCWQTYFCCVGKEITFKFKDAPPPPSSLTVSVSFMRPQHVSSCSIFYNRLYYNNLFSFRMNACIQTSHPIIGTMRL